MSDKRIIFFREKIKRQLHNIREDIGLHRYTSYCAYVDSCNSFEELRSIAELDLQIDMLEYTRKEIKEKLMEENITINDIKELYDSIEVPPIQKGEVIEELTDIDDVISGMSDPDISAALAIELMSKINSGLMDDGLGDPEFDIDESELFSDNDSEDIEDSDEDEFDIDESGLFPESDEEGLEEDSEEDEFDIDESDLFFDEEDEYDIDESDLFSEEDEEDSGEFDIDESELFSLEEDDGDDIANGVNEKDDTIEEGLEIEGDLDDIFEEDDIAEVAVGVEAEENDGEDGEFDFDLEGDLDDIFEDEEDDVVYVSVGSRKNIGEPEYDLDDLFEEDDDEEDIQDDNEELEIDMEGLDDIFESEENIADEEDGFDFDFSTDELDDIFEEEERIQTKPNKVVSKHAEDEEESEFDFDVDMEGLDELLGSDDTEPRKSSAKKTGAVTGVSTKDKKQQPVKRDKPSTVFDTGTDQSKKTQNMFNTLHKLVGGAEKKTKNASKQTSKALKKSIEQAKRKKLPIDDEFIDF